ncbi:MAG: hypothetical protein LC791_19840 [Acidobacteria bacterium]|nr:hypothetical protein [Acidobacteriota bacterium]
MSEFIHHLRVGARLLARSPGTTLGAFLSLALGVGACTTVFTWINGILLQPFPGVVRSGHYQVLATRTPAGALEPSSGLT